MSAEKPSIAIVGAGIIGLSCAWEMSKRGAKVTIFDKGEPGRGATYAAAGMLGARYEYAVGKDAHPRLLDLSLQSSSLWQSFGEELQSVSAYNIGYSDSDTLMLTPDASDPNELDEVAKRFSARKFDVEYLRNQQLHSLEPNLSQHITAALRIFNEGQVDNRLAVKALLSACHRSGVNIVNKTHGQSVKQSEFDAILLTVGASEDMAVLGIEPIKGAAFSVKPGTYLPNSIIRFGNSYIVPKRDRVIIGATVEPGVRDANPDNKRIGILRREAAKICPGIESAAVMEVWSGLRPGTPDHAPLFGQLPDGRFVAAGHHRNGILLAPVTAKIMANMIIEGSICELAATFSYDRFVEATA